MRRFIKTRWNAWKKERRRNQSKEPATTGAILFLLQFWTGLERLLERKWKVFKNLTKSSCCQRSNFGWQWAGWVRTYTDISAGTYYHGSLPFCLTHTIHIYIFRLLGLYVLLGVKSLLVIAMVTQQSLPSVWFFLATPLMSVRACVGGWLLTMTASEGGVEQKLWMH